MAAPRRQRDLFKNEETDLTSPRLNPLVALYSSGTSVPCPNVRLFNNLTEYETAIKANSMREDSSSMDVSSSASATAGSSTQTTDYAYGHGSGDANPSIHAYGHGSSGGTSTRSRGISSQFGSNVLDYGRHKNRTIDAQNVGTGAGCLPFAGDYAVESRRDFGSRYSTHDNVYSHTASRYPDSDIYRTSALDPYSARYPHRQRSSTLTVTHRHSEFSANTREQEYLDRKGFSDQDCEHLKISKRHQQSTAPSSKEPSIFDKERKVDHVKVTTTFASVGGAKGAWSYDKVETVDENMDAELPDSFEVVRKASEDVDEDRNVLNRMDEYSQNSAGPLNLLYRCVTEKLQARVWTRSAVCVRGICKGYIVAFDKHSNLAMTDVDEFYRNPTMKGMKLKNKKKLAEKRPPGYVEPTLPIEATWLGLRKEKLCVRHMNQVFIRGDNVVSINIVQDT